MGIFTKVKQLFYSTTNTYEQIQIVGNNSSNVNQCGGDIIVNNIATEINPEVHNTNDDSPDYDMSIHINPDAMAWTKFFRECNPDCNVDDDIMLAWFANSMMAMHDFILNKGPINGDHAQYLLDNEEQ